MSQSLYSTAYNNDDVCDKYETKYFKNITMKKFIYTYYFCDKKARIRRDCNTKKNHKKSLNKDFYKNYDNIY